MFGMMCLLAGMLSSCLKDHNDHYPEPQPAALLSIINASPGADQVDFELDKDNLINNAPIRYGRGLDYIRARPGKRSAIFSVYRSPQIIKADTINLEVKKFYSVYLSNVVSKPDIVLVNDSLAKPEAGKATIRLVNLSPDAGAVDLVIKAGATIATNKAYKGSSPFVAVSANTNYTLEIRKAGTATVLVSIPTVSLRERSVYTVWLHGLAAATDQTKLVADIQTNAVYY